MWGRIKIDKADKVFSQYIRLRDGFCKRCHSRVEKNDSGMPVSHNCSHYFGRGKESTRFDLENVDCLCFFCHQEWGSNNREHYRAFKIKQLGENGFNLLQVRAETYKKKDRALEYLKWKAALKIYE